MSSFDIGEDETRVSVVVYADEPRLAIGLADHFNKQDLLQAVSNIEYLEGWFMLFSPATFQLFPLVSRRRRSHNLNPTGLLTKPS